MMVVIVVILCTGDSLVETPIERGNAALVSLGLEWCVL